MIVILLASSQPRVGKSTLTKALLGVIPKSAPLSFAVPIKEICYNLYLDVMSRLDLDPEYSLLEYKQLKKDQPMSNIFSVSPRHQYCEGSNFITGLTSDLIWGKVATTNIKKASEYGHEVVIIDDWRRTLESDELATDPNNHIIKVYLDKDGVEVYQDSAITESFEGQLSPDNCDLSFKFTADWSNTEEIISILSSLVASIKECEVQGNSNNG